MTEVERLRQEAERIRRRQLRTAVQKLEASGELSAAERRILVQLSTRLTEAIVDPWVSGVTDETAPDLATRLVDDDW